MIEILSKRALEFVKSRSHFKESTDQKWESTLENGDETNLLSDNILTLSYSGHFLNDLEILFSETISRILIGRTVLYLEKLTFREIENYLRDENHLPVFDKTNLVEAEECFNVVKNSLLASIILNKIKNNYGSNPPQAYWDNLSFVEKNLGIKSVIIVLNKLFPIGKRLELVLAEDDLVTVALNDFPLVLGVLEEVLRSQFIFSKEKSSFKVVAV